MQKKIYLSLPITGQEAPSKEIAQKAQIYYEKVGFIVINPHQVKQDMFEILGRIPTEPEIMGADLMELGQCDAMILFPQWKNSKGCNLEIRFAKDYNIPIYEVHTDIKLEFSSTLKNDVNQRSKDDWITRSVLDHEPCEAII